ncbi:hypothetical protein FQN54_001445 [Arachnomyces sp. PD_36]|nr:hypothetical protein FQN54_001445 [Arachnomyces sp. PD_36]
MAGNPHSAGFGSGGQSVALPGYQPDVVSTAGGALWPGSGRYVLTVKVNVPFVSVPGEQPRISSGRKTPRGNCPCWYTPHGLGGHRVNTPVGTTRPLPGPARHGGVCVEVEQLPIWDEEDVPAAVYVKNARERGKGYVLDAPTHASIVVMKSCGVEDPQIALFLREHAKIDSGTATAISRNINAIPRHEVDALMQRGHGRGWTGRRLSMSGITDSDPPSTSTAVSTPNQPAAAPIHHARTQDLTAAVSRLSVEPESPPAREAIHGGGSSVRGVGASGPVAERRSEARGIPISYLITTPLEQPAGHAAPGLHTPERNHLVTGPTVLPSNTNAQHFSAAGAYPHMTTSLSMKGQSHNETLNLPDLPAREPNISITDPALYQRYSLGPSLPPFSGPGIPTAEPDMQQDRSSLSGQHPFMDPRNPGEASLQQGPSSLPSLYLLSEPGRFVTEHTAQQDHPAVPSSPLPSVPSNSEEIALQQSLSAFLQLPSGPVNSAAEPMARQHRPDVPSISGNQSMDAIVNRDRNRPPPFPTTETPASARWVPYPMPITSRAVDTPSTMTAAPPNVPSQMVPPATKRASQHNTPKRSQPRKPPPKNPESSPFQWDLEHRAFVLEKLRDGYLLSKTQRMFEEQFGTAPTLTEIRVELRAMENPQGDGMSREEVMLNVEYGGYQKTVAPISFPPHGRDELPLFKLPFHQQHSWFGGFFRDMGVDHAIIHELFEDHFKERLTDELACQLLDKTVQGIKKRIPVEADKRGWFKYLEEGQLGYINDAKLRKRVAVAQAWVRRIAHKEIFAKEMKALEAEKAKQGQETDNVDKEMEGGADEEDNVTRGIVADTIEEESEEVSEE